MLVLLLIIGFSVFSSRELLLENLLKAGPAVFLLNACALLCGYLLARSLKLQRQQQMTLGIEVGVQNATMATFLSLAVLNDWALVIVPTMYGCIMLLNAGVFVRWIRYRESVGQAV
jgi:BASS family bile acid:Na+ symporter